MRTVNRDMHDDAATAVSRHSTKRSRLVPKEPMHDLMALPAAPLEDWLRDNYFTAELAICASGVEPYTLRQLRELTGVTTAELDDLVFDDGYSLGTPSLRQAVARRWGDGDPTKVMTTNGSNEALGLLVPTLLRAGDEVVVVEPGYHALIGPAVSLGCRIRTWQLDYEHGYRPSLTRLEQLVSTRTRAIIVNFPHNPTGASLANDEVKELVGLAERVGAYLVWDAAFSELTYDTAPLSNPTRLYERAISVGTLSKSYGLPGLRFGWCIAPSELLDDCVRIRDYSTLHVSPLVELLAQRAVEHIDALLRPRLEQARRNRAQLRQWVEGQAGRITLAEPVGGVASFPRLEELENTDDFSQRLLDEDGVLVIPGSCFGQARHIRLGFGGSTDVLTKALDRLGRALRER